MHNDCLISLEYNKTLGAQTHSLFSQAKHIFSQFIYPPSLDKSHHLFTCQRIPVDLWPNHLSCVLVVFPSTCAWRTSTLQHEKCASQ